MGATTIFDGARESLVFSGVLFSVVSISGFSDKEQVLLLHKQKTYGLRKELQFSPRVQGRSYLNKKGESSSSRRDDSMKRAKCYRCGKFGHIKRGCKYAQEEEESRNEDWSSNSFMTETSRWSPWLS
ncbi:hypothetical protein Dimus_011339 [Dionaea muscipula]